MDRPDDRFADLLTAARGGDREARQRLLERCLPGLRAYVRLQGGGRIRARESHSDVVQSICREALVDLSDCRADSEAAFKRWLFDLALHKIIDRHRYHGAQKRNPDQEQAAGDEEGMLDAYATFCTPSRQAASREEIERAFDQLPDDYREVITSSRIVGLPHAEIAARMNRPESAVRMLLHRARARLAVLLGEPDGG